MADEGATPRELVLEACRRNNPELLLEVIDSVQPSSKGGENAKEQAVAALLNNTRDGMGNAALHVAASAASYEALDILLDQPGLETDPLDRMYAETPLHKAVALCNSLPLTLPPSSNSMNSFGPTSDSNSNLEDFLARNEGHATVEILLDAGCDPRIRNKSRMKAVDLVDGRNTALRDFLRRAELLLVEGEGVVDEDADDQAEADAAENSASDSE